MASFNSLIGLFWTTLYFTGFLMVLLGFDFYFNSWQFLNGYLFVMATVTGRLKNLPDCGYLTTAA